MNESPVGLHQSTPAELRDAGSAPEAGPAWAGLDAVMRSLRWG